MPPVTGIAQAADFSIGHYSNHRRPEEEEASITANFTIGHHAADDQRRPEPANVATGHRYSPTPQPPPRHRPSRLTNHHQFSSDPSSSSALQCPSMTPASTPPTTAGAVTIIGLSLSKMAKQVRTTKQCSQKRKDPSPITSASHLSRRRDSRARGSAAALAMEQGSGGDHQLRQWLPSTFVLSLSATSYGFRLPIGSEERGRQRAEQ
nr:hypothetical protein Iba_chr05cCG10090 [Ipomoea batatas]